ncbi:hypothetical protein SK128_019757 [Halocaridina rubra]|uniref:Major facilitator superfamily associated domain-containing protein n=1 Tax=Halocaridina rubra TaxID=373956 RepID=A0AAN9AD41_HALRR
MDFFSPGFSFLTDPWHVLYLEVLECVGNGLLTTASIMYCTALFSMETIASFRGVLATIYFGLGKLLGTVMGSEIRKLFGDRHTFQVYAAIAAISASVYCISYIIMKNCRSKKSSNEASTVPAAKDITRLKRRDHETAGGDLGVVNKGCDVSE